MQCRMSIISQYNWEKTEFMRKKYSITLTPLHKKKKKLR